MYLKILIVLFNHTICSMSKRCRGNNSVNPIKLLMRSCQIWAYTVQSDLSALILGTLTIFTFQKKTSHSCCINFYIFTLANYMQHVQKMQRE